MRWMGCPAEINTFKMGITPKQKLVFVFLRIVRKCKAAPSLCFTIIISFLPSSVQSLHRAVFVKCPSASGFNGDINGRRVHRGKNPLGKHWRRGTNRLTGTMRQVCSERPDTGVCETRRHLCTLPVTAGKEPACCCPASDLWLLCVQMNERCIVVRRRGYLNPGHLFIRAIVNLLLAVILKSWPWNVWMSPRVCRLAHHRWTTLKHLDLFQKNYNAILSFPLFLGSSNVIKIQ